MLSHSEVLNDCAMAGIRNFFGPGLGPHGLARLLVQVFEATDDERYTFAKDYKDLSRFHIEIDNKRTK